MGGRKILDVIDDTTSKTSTDLAKKANSVASKGLVQEGLEAVDDGLTPVEARVNQAVQEKVATICDNVKALSEAEQTLLFGEEWYRYFQDTYGADNVNWNVSSFDDMLAHPTSLRGYTIDEIADILGDGWTRGTYGSNGSGWKFIQNEHPDNMVFYHGGGGYHDGPYYGISFGKKWRTY